MIFLFDSFQLRFWPNNVLKVHLLKNSLFSITENIVKAQEEKQEQQMADERERREAADAIIRQAKEEEDEIRAKEEEEKRKDREDRLRRREENRGDGFQDMEDGEEIKEEVIEEEVKTEEIKEEVKEEPIETEVVKSEISQPNKQTIIVKPPPDAILNSEPLRMTRRTVQEINQGTLFFKLGQEGTFKSYINQFTSNPSALSKVQANEERVKRTHMSHKFSLTEASTFRWMGQLYGPRNQLINTLRQTMLQLESQVPLMFMHVNWQLMRKPWIQALNTSNTPKDFARALTVLQCCIKPALMVNVWYESLGHTSLKKITQQMKDDKKKSEKRERKELEDEAERLRPFMQFVKYTLGLKHQVSKQRGEEYRAHGQYGWLWLSATRRFTPCDARTVGLRAGPHRLAVKYTDIRNNSFKIVLMEPKAFKYLVAKQETMDNSKENVENNENGECETDNKIGIEKKKLEQALKNARLEHQVPEEDMFKEVVDVSAGLSNPTRILYPKVAKKTVCLDDFLARRLQLKSLEERRIELKYGNKAKATESSAIKKEPKDEEGEETKTSITSDLAEQTTEQKERDLKKFVEQAKKSIWSVYIPKLNEATKKSSIKPVHRHPELKCYSATCSENNCYSVTCGKFRAICGAVKEVYEAVQNLVKEAKSHGLELSTQLSITDKPETAVNCLRNLVKDLMKTKDDADNDLSIGISAVAQADQPTMNGEVKKEAEEKKDTETKPVVPNVNRVYSNANPSGKLYLKRIQTVAESKKQSKIIKYPLAPSFFAPTRKKRSILILAKHDAKRLARRAGFVTCEGFNYNSKSNNLVWPYPCPRPTFKTAWLFRTASLGSIQTVAMQVRILWACLRWDDLQTKSNSLDGKHQETTDSAITTTEIIKHRHTGRFQEVTEYYQRKVTIPLDVPTRNKQEITPIRSGLRKRKRDEAPQQTEPEVVERWMPEEKLELWEIRAYRDRLDRDKNASVTRTRTGITLREPQRFDPSAQQEQQLRTSGRIDLKNKMEDQLKQQQQARSVLTTNQSQIQVQHTTAPTIIRRVQNPDGTISIIKTTMATPNVSPAVVRPGTIQSPQQIQPGTKKVFLSKDGKIIGAQLVQQNPTAATNKISIPSVGGVQNPVATPTIVAPSAPQTPQQTQQKVQIVRSSDGKIQVRGLLPGQQLVQMPDGKLQIFSQPTPAAPAAQPQLPQQQPTTTPTVVSQPSRIVVHPGGGSSTVTSGTPSPQIQKPQTPTAGGAPPKSIVATPLQPGQAIPPGTSVFMSGGKTYCIPKATMTLATQQQNATTTPALPVAPLPPAQLEQTVTSPPTNTTTPTIGTAQAQNASGQKQMVEVKSLGQNTVTIKGNQMIVSGPDIAQAQQIAKQLSTGAAKLATLNGKQVLISTQPTVQGKTTTNVVTPTTPNVVTTTTTANSALPVQTEIPNNIKLPSEPLPPNVIKEPTNAVEPVATQQNQSAQVTAQLIQTPQGPRIVLQGIQGANLNKDQLQSIQQQVKEQLLKAQAEAKLQGKVPPTKIAIQLPNLPANAAAVAPNQPQVVKPVNVATPPVTPATPTSNVTTTKQIITTPSGQRVILMGTSSANQQKQIVTVPHSTTMSPVTPVNETPKQSLLMNTLTSPKTPTSVLQKQTLPTGASPEKFELTQDYIQQTIQQALRKDNLSPEIEQKLLALQQHSITDKTIVIKKNEKPIDPATGEPMDDEWEGASNAERSLASRNRRKKQEELSTKRTPSQAAMARSVNRVPRPASTTTPVTTGQVQMSEDKKQQLFQQRIQSALLRHKEHLKRDIGQKRSQQEKELQIDIQKEIDRLKGGAKMVTLTAGQPLSEQQNTEPESQVMNNIEDNAEDSDEAMEEAEIEVNNVTPPEDDEQENALKRKRRESNETNESSTGSSPTFGPKPKKKRRSSGPSSGGRKDKLYCICKTRYDPKK